MEAVRSELVRAIEWLQDSAVVEKHYQAAMLIRVAVLDYERRKVAQELDAVQALVLKLEYGAQHPVTLVAVEGLACLVADNPMCREQLRKSGGHQLLVGLLQAVQNDPHSDLSHRLLMIFQIVSDSEPDRKLLLSCDIGSALMPFLSDAIDPEVRFAVSSRVIQGMGNFQAVQVVEHALSAVCNIAAGTAPGKARLAECGVISALLDHLAPTGDEGLAQLAALCLRNLSKHPQCKLQIINSGGVCVLLDFLSEGLEVLQYPLRCEITYKSSKAPSSTLPGLMAVDIERGQIILAPEDPPGCCAATSRATSNPHMDSTAERYSMLMKVMRFCHPDSDQLDLSFEVDGAGAVKMPGSGSGKPPRELLKVSIDECNSQELSELLTKLLNKLYTQSDFDTNYECTPLDLAALDPLATSSCLKEVI